MDFRYFLGNDTSVAAGSVKADTRKEAIALVQTMHSDAKDIRVQGENFQRNRRQILAGDVISRKPN